MNLGFIIYNKNKALHHLRALDHNLFYHPGYTGELKCGERIHEKSVGIKITLAMCKFVLE